MNERIRLLAEQATSYIEPSANDGVCWHFDKEKFAELIVKKCCEIADEVERADVPTLASKFIKAHFGVES